MKVNVFEKHILQGVQKNCLTCAVSRALADQIPGRWHVGKNFLQLDLFHRGGKTEHIRYKTPEPVAEFIKKFDERKNLAKPFSFDLEMRDLITHKTNDKVRRS